MRRQALAGRSAVQSAAMPALLQRARAEPARPLDASVGVPLSSRLGFDLSSVRVHAGQASAQAADLLGARAFTIGSDVHLGAEGRSLGGAARARLLAHEAVHVVQQGGRPAALQGSLQVSDPHDASEVEADRIANTAISAAGAPMPGARLNVSPAGVQLHRDLKGAYDLAEGRMRIDMTTQSNPGGKNGMSGTLSFLPNAAAPDAGSIRLLQIVRDEDLGTGGEYTWTGGEANRNAMQTAADAGRMITGGFFVDHSAAAAAPRTARADRRVSPFYRDYWPNSANSHDGWKSGSNVRTASLWDFPGSSGNRRFSLETFAVAARGNNDLPGHVFGGAKWGFTISNAAAGTITAERVTYHDRPSSNYYAAIRAFDDFYHNPGRPSAPK